MNQFIDSSLRLSTIFLSLLLVGFMAHPALAQRMTVKEQRMISGTVTAIRPGEISIKEDGQEDPTTYKIQDKTERAISIDGRPVRIPAAIKIRGNLPMKLIESGMIVGFKTRCNVYGKGESALTQVNVLNGDQASELNVEFLERPEKNSDFANVDIVGRVRYIKGRRFQIEVPKAKWSKKERMTFNVTEDATFTLTDDGLSRVKAGDKVLKARVLRLTDTEWAVHAIDIELGVDRQILSTKFNDKLANKFSHLSDEPGKPREVRSEHFVLKTDLSDRSANVLLEKLETMFSLVSGYYRARPNVPIVCYVVRDLSQWDLSQLNPVGVQKIREPAGVTISRRLGNDTYRSIVYACDNHGVVQHEAVHAFCYQTFGSTGPVWYSEGMAELGNYWKPDNPEVNVDPIVINYLTKAKPKKMANIVAAGQITGDSWQAYAWRWALCHLLAANPNYSRRFKSLGVNLMRKKNDSFDLAFGDQKDAISFEYDQFVQNFGNGYRVDLCVWDWKTKASKLSPAKLLKKVVKAKAGWQATKLSVVKGTSYDFIAEGSWKTNAVLETNADGESEGGGRLVAAVFNDYQLGEPFELGTRGAFVAESDGQLFVRCREDWTSLSDNDGTIALHLRRTPRDKATKD